MGKPSEFFLTIIDVFVIILPGVILIALVALAWDPELVYDEIAGLEGRESTLLLLIAYVLGHLLSGFGSLLEDRFYESCLGKSLREREDCTFKALRKRVQQILATRLGGMPVTNARRFAATFVENAGGYGGPHLARKDADRRFFRNLSVAVALAFVLEVVFFSRNAPDSSWDEWMGPALAALTLLSTTRYLDQNRKYSRDAYECLIAMEGLGKLGDPPGTPPQ